jgi:HSP20 family protein
MKSSLTEWTKDSKEIKNPFELMRKQVNGIFDSFFDSSLLDGFTGEAWKTPRMDLVETEGDFRLTAEVPGMEEKDINISLERGVLTIHGEKKNEQEFKDGTYHHVERSFGSFQRSVRLPQRIKEDEVSASYKNGILSVVLPKSEPDAGARRIEIQKA